MFNRSMATSSKQDNGAFMSFIVEVDVSTPKWAKTVRKIISSMEGMSSCWINENGLVEVSGTVDPSLLMKKLGKAGKNAHVHHLKFGKCSSNLFMPLGARNVHHYHFGGAAPASYHHNYNMNNRYINGYGGSNGRQIHCTGYGARPHYELAAPHGGYHHHYDHHGVPVEQYGARRRRAAECDDECEGGVTIQCCTVM